MWCLSCGPYHVLCEPPARFPGCGGVLAKSRSEAPRINQDLAEKTTGQVTSQSCWPALVRRALRAPTDLPLGQNFIVPSEPDTARLASMPEEGYPCHLVLKVQSWLGSYPEPSGFVDLSSYIEKRSPARPILLTNLTNLTKMQSELTTCPLDTRLAARLATHLIGFR
jgi:hypothetical protein